MSETKNNPLISVVMIFLNAEKFIKEAIQSVLSQTYPNSELVFVGYGVVAPEYGWDDFKGVDVRGKTIVFLVNDPAMGIAGFLFDDAQLGSAAVDLVVEQLNHNERGLPDLVKRVLLPGRWFEGRSLRPER